MSENFSALDEAPYLREVANDPEKLLDFELVENNTLIGLRNISKYAIKNNPIAASFCFGMKNWIIPGKVGFNVKANDYLKKPIEKILKKAYRAVDINNNYNMTDFLSGANGSVFKNGDALIHFATDKERGDIETYMEVIDAARIVTPWDFRNDPLVRNGVKYSSTGKELGYYVVPLEAMYESFWRLRNNDFRFVPKYKKYRGYTRQSCYLARSMTNYDIGLSRQYPPLTPSTRLLRFLNAYIEAVVIGAKNAACVVAFVTSSNASGAIEGLDTTAKKESMQLLGKAQPGMTYFIPRGDHMHFPSPSRPADNAGAFIKQLYMIASASIRAPYIMSAIDVSDTNYSSYKGAFNETQLTVSRWQNMNLNITQLYNYQVIQEAISKGMVKASNSFEIITNLPKLRPIDDEKFSRAEAIQMENGTLSKQQSCLDKNSDYDEVREQIKQEKIDAVEDQAEIEIIRKQLEEKHGIDIIISTDQKQSQGGSPRNEEDKKKQRKDDGNWKGGNDVNEFNESVLATDLDVELPELAEHEFCVTN